MNDTGINPNDFASALALDMNSHQGVNKNALKVRHIYQRVTRILLIIFRVYGLTEFTRHRDKYKLQTWLIRLVRTKPKYVLTQVRTTEFLI